MIAEHIPGRIITQVASIAGPDGEYLQVEIAVTKCSCGQLHTAAADLSQAFAYGSSTFQLGVLFAQLNRWTVAVEDNVANRNGCSSNCRYEITRGRCTHAENCPNRRHPESMLVQGLPENLGTPP